MVAAAEALKNTEEWHHEKNIEVYRRRRVIAEKIMRQMGCIFDPKQVGMVRMLKKEGIRIDGIGIQGHWGLNFPKKEYIEAAIDTFATLGVKVMITELDVDVLPITKEGQLIGKIMSDPQWQYEEFKTFLDPYRNGLPVDVETQLADRYAELFGIFYNKRDKIDRVTVWGLHDGMEVIRNDKIDLDEVDRFDKILLSPGPGIPAEAGILLPLIKKYAPTKSILGVCLGHQAIAESFGGTLENTSEVFHAMKLRNPLLIGFGISNAETLQAAYANANGGIVGSQFIKELQQSPDYIDIATNNLLKRLELV